MARVTAPLLSLSASGKFADTLVASTWKGVPVMRQYVKPSNPNTQAQSDQRGYMTACVNAWRNYFTLAATRTAWNRLALLLADTMSGFNAFCRNAVKVAKLDPDASFGTVATPTAAYKASITVKNLDDGATGDESGNFEIWAGSEPSNLLLIESVAITAGVVIGTIALSTAAAVRYAKIRKSSRDRSGIFQFVTILS